MNKKNLLSKKASTDICECIVEVRYQPEIEFFDQRGSWTKNLADKLTLSKFVIDNEHIQLCDDEEKIGCNVAVSSAGYFHRNPKSLTDFQAQSSLFINTFFSLEPFNKRLMTLRIGVRIRTCITSNYPFKKLLSRFRERYFNMNEQSEKIIGATILDIGAPINFEDEVGCFNTSCGPMESAQIYKYFTWAVNVPNVGLYYDVDYWTNPGSQLSVDDIEIQTNKLIIAGGKRKEEIVNIILGN